jgi:hypothetical protein
MRLFRRRYFNELLIDVNFVLSLVPRPFTTAMIASAIPAAISPYSMAVAPVSSARNLGLFSWTVMQSKSKREDESECTKSRVLYQINGALTIRASQAWPRWSLLDGLG